MSPAASMPPSQRRDGDLPPRPRVGAVAPAVLAGEKPKRWMKMYRTEIAASSSSVLSTFLAYPLDSVKTRMQSYKFRHFTDCVQHTYRTEGGKAFWRGRTRMSVMGTRLMLQVSRPRWPASPSCAPCPFPSTRKPSTLTRRGSSAPLAARRWPWSTRWAATRRCRRFRALAPREPLPGAAITTIACPFELTKLSAQLSVLMANRNTTSVDDPIRRSYEQKGTFKTAQNIVRHRGVLGLYSGFHLHLSECDEAAQRPADGQCATPSAPPSTS